MEMKYCLPCYFSIVLNNIKSIKIQCILIRFRNLSCYFKYMCCSVIIKFIYMVNLILRQYKYMSFSGRTGILIKSIRWNLAVCQLAKNTIILFHTISSLCAKFVEILLFTCISNTYILLYDNLKKVQLQPRRKNLLN